MDIGDRRELTERVRRRCIDLGFDVVGFAPADPLEGADFYARWVALGFAGEMGYLERNLDKRADPARLVPGARSVICLGMHYYRESAETHSNTNTRGADLNRRLRSRRVLPAGWRVAVSVESAVRRSCLKGGAASG